MPKSWRPVLSLRRPPSAARRRTPRWPPTALRSPGRSSEALAPARVLELPLVPRQQPGVGRHSWQRRQHKGQRRGDGGPAAAALARPLRAPRRCCGASVCTSSTRSRTLTRSSDRATPRRGGRPEVETTWLGVQKDERCTGITRGGGWQAGEARFL
jgi:hypothetical protein